MKLQGDVRITGCVSVPVLFRVSVPIPCGVGIIVLRLLFAADVVTRLRPVRRPVGLARRGGRCRGGVARRWEAR